MGNDLEKTDSLTDFFVIREKNSGPTKKFLGSNAILLPLFLGLCISDAIFFVNFVIPDLLSHCTDYTYISMSAFILRNFTSAGYNLRLCDICENNVPALLQMVNSLLNYDSLESSRVCQTNGLLFFEYKSGGISPPSTRES